MMATAPLGHNLPPDPFDGFKAHIDDLFDMAKDYLDGSAIETEAQSEDVSRLLNMARKVAKDADLARAEEKKPHDDAAKAVQAKWRPLIERAEQITSVSKNVIAAFLRKQEEQQRAAAEAARLEAEEKAAAVRIAHQEASANDLASQESLRALEKEAEQAAKAAAKADKARPLARGGERAVGLVDLWTPILSDPVTALKHYKSAQPEALKAWLLDQAARDVRAGKRIIPGFDIQHERVAR